MEVEDLFGAGKAENVESTDNSPLKSLQVDLDFYSDSIREISAEIREEGLSEYPIFIAHQHEVHLGEVILDKAELNTKWTINASTIEEFVEAGVIKKDREAGFIKHYKSPTKFMCLFVVVAEGANFVFYPYK